MSKAFTKETDDDDDDLEVTSNPIPAGARNYMTPGGWQHMRDEVAAVTAGPSRTPV